MKRFCVSLICALVLGSVLASADTYIKQSVHTDAYVLDGQAVEATDDVVEIWIDRNRLAKHGQDRSLILLWDKKKVYLVDHTQKTFVEMTIPVDISSYIPASLAQLMAQVSLSVSPTEERRTIGKRECRAYDVEIETLMTTMTIKAWATSELPFDGSFYREKLFPEMAKVNYLLPKEAVAELASIEGFIVLEQIRMAFMGAELNARHEVVEMSRKSAPDSVYRLPEGYTRTERFAVPGFEDFSHPTHPGREAG